MALRNLSLCFACAQLASAISVQPAALAVPRGLVVASSSSSRACGAASSQHRPPLSKSLADYKGNAEECLSWCGGYSSKCFRGCLNDCVGHLKAPPCPAFVLSTDGCKDACDRLTPIYGCLQTVDANSTQDCHVQFASATIPETGCPYAS
mmetsp:Transcript_9432/g.24452  ORF Transcript_9432/g.24452 Transcript_9432/m.24452 type:complete len:150 (-) Transcript_9432:33-482(-)